MKKAIEVLNEEQDRLEEFITLLESKIAIYEGNIKDLTTNLLKSKIERKEIRDALLLLRM